MRHKIRLCQRRRNFKLLRSYLKLDKNGGIVYIHGASVRFFVKMLC